VISNDIIACLNVVFLDNFLLTTGMIVLLTVMIMVQRIKGLGLPRRFILTSWFLIVVASLILAVVTALDFFSHPQGLDRLASLPLIIAMTPLLVCSLIVSFMYPGGCVVNRGCHGR
jgi:hypothetical protein